MFVLTNRQMREADLYTIERLGVPSLLLMERAGLALAEASENLAAEGKIVCLCGGGNNGGDGFVCARVLKGCGREVAVVCVAENFSNDCRVNMEKWTALGGELHTEIPEDCALIVDCLYGTGFHGALSGADADLVSEAVRLKGKGVKILSADIPSGVCGDSGCVDGVAIFADKTLCIGEIKTGVLLNDGIDYAGQIECADIGISLCEKERYACLIDHKIVCARLPKRKRNSHKGSYGKAAIIAGSKTYTGAAFLSASACLRSGCGYTILCVPKGILPHYILRLPEVLLQDVCEGDVYHFDKEKLRGLLSCDSIAYGMGMGVSEEVAKGAVWLIENFEGRLILDADGLNALSLYEKDLQGLFARKKCDVLLTPHVKEFSRLSNLSVDCIKKDPLSVVKSFSSGYGVSLLMKNAVSLLSDGESVCLNATGCSGQAKAGSGDVLSGLIAGVCAMGVSAYDGGAIGAYIAGKAAENAALEVGEYALTASDVISYLGGVFKDLSVQ